MLVSFGLYILTRRLAACTQAVIILRSTSYIAIELQCSAFEVVRNSVEWVKIVISAYERFSLFSLAFAVVCLFFHFSNKRDISNFRVTATLGSVNLFTIIQGISQDWENSQT